MKAFIKILFLGGVVFTLSSCYTSSQGTVYRAPDGTIYRSGEVYRDRNGNVYRDGVIVRTNNRKHLPPVQAKKVYGGDAKDYAPGQQKKKHHKHNKDGHKKGKNKNRR
ncbi:hypothetical protein BPO_0274 [Bergeyella porcorum]|uniref:Lipoprotein n=1 Tax=Bergeyella porcorum TaxID=1735111 RepID=A0AAU0F086_9FLAO